MNIKPILDLLKKLSSEERIFLKNVFDISCTIRQTIREFDIDEVEFCREMGISTRKYNDYFSGGYNYSLMEIAKLEALRFKKIMEQKEIEAKSESEVAQFPKYKYSTINP